MSDSFDQTDVHVGTLRAQVPEGEAHQARLRLSTMLAGADLRPPGLAPAQVLLVREMPDPEPGRIDVRSPGPAIDRTWERAAREALSDRLRRAVRPRGGRVPPEAEAVLFRDAAEAWACWSRTQARSPRPFRDAAPWWMQSLAASPDAPPAFANQSHPPRVADLWQARPRLVPALTAHLASWNDAAEVVGQFSDQETRRILQAVCETYGVVPPPGSARKAETASSSAPDGEQDQDPDPDSDQAAGEPPASGARRDPPASSSREGFRHAQRDAADVRPEDGAERKRAPWTRYVRQAGGSRAVQASSSQTPAVQQLLGVALTLHQRPEAARSHSFRAAWGQWKEAAQRVSDSASPDGEPAQERRAAPEDHASDRETKTSTRPDKKESRAEPDSGDPSAAPAASEADETAESASSSDRPRRYDGGRAREETGQPARSDPYTTTELGGVLYLVNALAALDLPSSAETPPVGEYVGAWAVLDALARGLLGPNDDVLRPNDPLWHVLASLDNRPFDVPAGRALDEAVGSDPAYRMPPAWLDAPAVDAPVEGRWAATDGRLQVWTTCGCVADLPADLSAAEAGPDALARQAEAEWSRMPAAGTLRRAEPTGSPPLAPEPDACTPALAHWTARAAPYLRHRLAAALDADAPDDDALDDHALADLVAADGRLYVTDTHVDVVLPLTASRFDVRVAGLDRNPGWWQPGGRVVRFHFEEME